MRAPGTLARSTSPSPSPVTRVLNPYRTMGPLTFTRRFLADLGYVRRPQFLSLATFARRALQETPPGAVVADLGAGRCQWRALFVDCRYVALDRAVGNASWDYSRLSAVADVLHVPLRTATVDAALAMAVIGHLPDAGAFFREAFRVLRPGGRLYALSEFAKAEHQAPHDFQRLTRFALEHHAREAGFASSEIWGSNSFFSSLLNLAESCAWKTGPRDAGWIYWGLIQALVRTGLIRLLYAFDQARGEDHHLFPVYFFITARKPEGA